MGYVGRGFASLVLAACAAGASVANAAEFRSATDEAVILYDAPSTQSQKRFIVSQGYPLEVVVVLQVWVKVRDATGALNWVEAGKVSAKQRTVMVKVASAQVRVDADENSPPVFRAQQNVLLELTEALASGWLKVRHRDGSSGFIRAAQVWGV